MPQVVTSKCGFTETIEPKVDVHCLKEKAVIESKSVEISNHLKRIADLEGKLTAAEKQNLLLQQNSAAEIAGLKQKVADSGKRIDELNNLF